MKKLLVLLFLGTMVVSTGAWSLVVIDDGFETYPDGACLAPGSNVGDIGLGTWEWAGGTDPADTGRARVTSVSAAPGGVQSARWQVPPGTVSTANNIIVNRFPLEWRTGTVVAYMDCMMNVTGGLPLPPAFGSNGELCTIKFYDDHPAQPGYTPNELCRVRYQKWMDGTSAFGIRGAALGNLVDNPVNGTWYHFKLEFNLTNKTFSAYEGDGDRSGENSGHWTVKLANSGFLTPAAQGLKYLWWIMWTRGTEATMQTPAYCYLDNVYVEGPSLQVPAFDSPGDNCGWSGQFRYFTQTPTFTWASGPHQAYQIRVFDQATVQAPGFNADTSTAAVWDSGVVSTTTNSYTVSSPLPASNLANPPSNILYVFGKVWLNEFSAWGAWSLPDKDFVCASAPPTSPSTPVITAPAVYVTSTDPPTVAFTVASGDWDQSSIVITDTTAATTYFDSNWTTGAGPVNLAALPSPPGPLVNGHIYSIGVAVRKGCTDSAGYASGTASGSFACYTSAPDLPIVNAPVDPSQGLQPVVIFTGNPHTQMNVKITSDSAGNTVVWETGEVSSTAYGANCNTALTEGQLYYAWAKIGNPRGWGFWSFPSSFHAVRTAEAIDIRHMDETGLLTTRLAIPDDMFFGGMPTYDQTGCAILQPPCSPGILRVTDCGVGGLLRRHNCPVDFNKGTTVVAAVRTWVPDEVSDIGEGWKAGAIVVTDADNHCGASIKVRPDLIGICTNGTTWSTAVLAPTNDFRVIRITAKAATYNDPTSIDWKVYVDETLQLTATGTITQTLLETGVGSWVTGQVCIGQGSYGIQGVFDFDWLAVNGSGAYTPGDWNQALAAYNPGGTPRDWKLTGATYASVADAIANGETGWAIITASNAVINHVGTIAYYVQDALTGAGSLKIDAVGNSADLGKALDDITGLLSSDGLVKVVKNSPVVNIASTQPDPALPYSALVSNIKSLGGSPCVTQLVDLGGPFVQNTGRLVKIFGTLPANPSDPADPVPGYSSGAQIFYVDDLSNTSWVLDGRDGELPGLRILLDLSYETQIWDPLTSTGIGQGALVQIEGVSSLDDYITGGVITTVRKIADPVITQIPK